MRGGQREVSELPSFGWEIACWEKTLQGVKGRTDRKFLVEVFRSLKLKFFIFVDCKISPSLLGV